VSLIRHNRSVSEVSFKEKNRRGTSLTRTHSIRKSDAKRFSFPSTTASSPTNPGNGGQLDTSVTIPAELVKPITRTYQLKNENRQLVYATNFTNEPLSLTTTTTHGEENV
ncbi:12713_t:CDS:1, partial [Acaulospora morrowiae]